MAPSVTTLPGPVARISTRRLLQAGILGPALFVSVFLVEGATRPGYDPVRQFVSLLSLGEGGWVQVANFVVAGVLFMAFGLGLRRSWSTGVGSRWAPRLIVGVGVALIWSGLFTTDPAQGYPPGTPLGLPSSDTWHAYLHFLGAAIVFLGLPASQIIGARRAAAAGERSFAIYSTASAIVMLVTWVAAFAVPGPGGQAGEFAGLFQRVAVVAGLTWVAFLAGRLIRNHTSAIESSRTQARAA
jgi:hypothetical membrane protein